MHSYGLLLLYVALSGTSGERALIRSNSNNRCSAYSIWVIKYNPFFVDERYYPVKVYLTQICWVDPFTRLTPTRQIKLDRAVYLSRCSHVLKASVIS
jgi:hypothetical protein